MKIGILGSGQLSRMLALAGIPLGLNFAFYDPQSSKCVAGLGESFQGGYTDFESLDRFLEKTNIITYENENIPLSSLKYILEKGINVHPCIDAIQTMQDRLLEKNFLTNLDIPTAKYQAVNNKNELNKIVEEFSFPIIVKRRTNSYDGRGQIIIKKTEDLNTIDDSQLSNAIVEKFVDFDREISLIGCRDIKGNYAFYDVCQNVHKNGILYSTNNIENDPMYKDAKAYLTRIMDSLEYVGVCTAEYFVCNNNLIVNELAPRVHNTGHWTIEGATISQFENHLRCISGYSLGDTSSVGNFLMYNILGSFPNKEKLLGQHCVHLHDYQKAPRKNRKIGHINFLNRQDIGNKISQLLNNS